MELLGNGYETALSQSKFFNDLTFFLCQVSAKSIHFGSFGIGFSKESNHSKVSASFLFVSLT